MRTEQQEEWEMAKHNLKMAKKTLSQESLSRSDYTISSMINSNSNGFSDPGGRDAKRSSGVLPSVPSPLTVPPPRKTTTT